MNEPIPFNLNDFISVKLTDKGRDIFREYYAPAKVRLREDEDGWMKFQMWEAMAIFGKHVHMGLSDLPFVDMNILIHP